MDYTIDAGSDGRFWVSKWGWGRPMGKHNRAQKYADLMNGFEIDDTVEFAPIKEELL